MLRLNFDLDTNALNTYIAKVKALKADIIHDVEKIAQETADDMKSTIETNRKRSKEPSGKAHLVDLIKTETIRKTQSEILIGVGNINFIEENHKDPNFPGDTGRGWRLLNWGGLPGNGTNPRGQWSGASNSRFQYDSSKNTRLSGSNNISPVQGIHFIETAFIKMKNKLIQKLRGK